MKPHSAVTVVVLPFLLTLLSIPAARAACVPAIYVFGDSTADVGNNNHLQVGEDTRANYPHNGIDYPGGHATGRFCNGYVAVDFLAKMMGFQESPPAHFSMCSDRLRDFRGVNFASGGSGIFDGTGVNKSFSMNTQIMFFEEIAGQLAREKGWAAAKAMLSNSIFIFSTVNNDIFGYIRTFGARTSMAAKKLFISAISKQFKNQLMKLYALGARKFVVMGTGLLGCPPAIRTLSPSGYCNRDLNHVSLLFNEAMKMQLQRLSSTAPGMKYSYIDNVNVAMAVSSRPSRYGFKELNVACCGSGRFNAETLCVANVTVCANRDEYFSWDYVHPTQAACKVMADFAYGGSKKFAAPLNVKKLVKA